MPLRHSVGFLATGLLLTLTLWPSTTLAAEVRTGQTPIVGPEEVIDDDLYIFGGVVTIQGRINGDVIVSGGNLTIEGEVTGDLLSAGGATTVSRTIGGSVRAAGGSITLNGPVGDDVVVAGGSVVLGPSAHVGRDVLVGAGSIAISSDVGRNVLAGAGTLTIEGRVGGDVRAEVDRLRLEDGARIEGDLLYTSREEATIAPGAVVQGRTERRPLDLEHPLDRALDLVVGWLRVLLGLFVLGLMLVLAFPSFGRLAIGTLGARPWASLGLGLALLLALPFVALLLFVAGLFVGGWWLALILLAAYGLALALSYAVAGLFVGHWVLGRVGYRASLVSPLLLGLVLLLLLGWVPIVGGIVMVVALLFGLGALALALASAYRAVAAGAAEQP